jgi:hypothetical protein
MHQHHRLWRRGQVALLAVVLGGLALSHPARAELVLSIDQPDRAALPGSIVAFTGTITNLTGVDLKAAADLFLNFNSFDATALSFNQVLGALDFSLPNGSTSPDVELFDALVDPLATLAGSPYLADATVSDSLGNVSDPITIRIDAVPAPLIGHGLLVLLVVGGILLGVKFLERIRNRPEPGPLALLFTFAALLIGFAGVYPRPAAFQRRFGHLSLVGGGALLAGTMLLIGPARAAVTPVSLYTAGVATSVWDTDPSKVGVQLQIVNNGTGNANGVSVKSVTVQGGSYSGSPVPILLGSLDAGENTMLDLVITVPTTDGTKRYRVTLSGSYVYAGTVYGFTLNLAVTPNGNAPGPFAVHTGTTAVQNPNLVTYPNPPTSPPVFGPNAENPIFIPLGPQRQLSTPTPTGTDLGTSAGSPAVVIPVNTGTPDADATQIPPDPNAAASMDGVVLSTYNTHIKYSTDAGATFTDVNIKGPQPGNPSRKTFFPESDGGVCCDQVVVYLPTQNLFVWLLQYNPITACATNCGPPVAMNATYQITQANRVRIAWATPAAIKSNFWNAWTYADLTGPQLGTTNAEWMDYPDLAWSNTYLYFMIDHGNTTPGKIYGSRRFVARLSLADIANPSATVVNFGYAELTGPSGLDKSHFVQRAPGRMVVGALKDSSTLNIFTWDDNTNSIPSPASVAISTITRGSSYTSPAPDGADWLAASFPGNITGATYRSVVPGLGVPSQDQYIFAFDAGQNPPGRPQAYVRLETVTPSMSGFQIIEEYDIWNSNYAFAMAALSSDFDPVTNFVLPEVGINIAVGGGTVGYPQMSVGFKNDFVVYQVTSNNATQTAKQMNGSVVTRFGDYLSARFIEGSEAQFGAEVYDVKLNPVPPGTAPTCLAAGCTDTPRFVRFGRPPFKPPS